MINIKQNNYTKPINENVIITEQHYLNYTVALKYTAGDSYASLNKIQEMINKIETKSSTDFYLFVFSKDTWSNILADVSALRMYDNTYSTALKEELQSNSITLNSGKPLLITFSDLVKNEGYLIECSNTKILDGTTELKLNDSLIIEYNVDKSKELIKIIQVHKMTDIKDY